MLSVHALSLGSLLAELKAKVHNFLRNNMNKFCRKKECGAEYIFTARTETTSVDRIDRISIKGA